MSADWKEVSAAMQKDMEARLLRFGADVREDEKRKYAQYVFVLSTIKANVNNPALSGDDFRTFVSNCLSTLN